MRDLTKAEQFDLVTKHSTAELKKGNVSPDWAQE